jgi:RimJ/RimL family protein N-acetyltransferase
VTPLEREPRLADGTLALRAWSEDDLPILAEASRDAYVALIEGVPAPFDEAAGRAWVVECERGRGIAGRAVRLVCGWALSADTGIERIQATVHLWNGASQRVLERSASSTRDCCAATPLTTESARTCTSRPSARRPAPVT